MGGVIPVMCNNLGGTLPYMGGGQIRILAQTGKSRSASAPDVPTFDELGIKSLDTGLWMGIEAPKGTPKAIVDKLNAALTKVMALPSTKERFAKLGATPLNPAPAAFEERIKADRKSWDPVLKSVDLNAK
jgi:tripartite-type tricarboxylate transporter receptor subunit TctC